MSLRCTYTFYCEQCSKELEQFANVSIFAPHVFYPSLPDGWITILDEMFCSKKCFLRFGKGEQR